MKTGDFGIFEINSEAAESSVMYVKNSLNHQKYSAIKSDVATISSGGEFQLNLRPLVHIDSSTYWFCICSAYDSLHQLRIL